MSHLALSLFGTFQVALNGRPVSGFVSRKAQALLAYLAVEADRAHGREELAGLLWPDRPESSARAYLRSVLANVRRVIGDREAFPPFLLISRQTIQFNQASDHELDVAIFHHRPPDGAPSGALDDMTIGQLEGAVTRIHGPFLAGFSLPDSPAFEEWALLRRESFQRQISATLFGLARHFSDKGKHEQALHHAQRWVDMDPWQEEAHRQIMRLLVAAGQRSKALRQYETCRRMLVEELGVEPTEETTRLYEQIRAGEDLRAAGAPRQVTSPNLRLPRPLTPLVGRERELADLSRLLADPDQRLITLVGPGGIGKTHLAVTAAAACRQFEDGVCFISLAPLQSADTMPPAVAKALGFSFYAETEPRKQLLDYVRSKELLLVMDNFEHLLDGVGLVVELLEATPRVKLLATSRLRLGVSGEQLYPLGGLTHPDKSEAAELGAAHGIDRYAAITLFCQYAQRLRPDFTLTDGNLAAVARICALVSGMPLGIVLAASWIEMLGPNEIVAEIERGFDFLQTDLHDVPERQQSLVTVFEHSWTLLPAEERTLFQQLTLFRGGFTRRAALAMAGATLPKLLVLVHKFLLHRTPAGRFEIHELLRQFAAQKLARRPADQQAARDRHSAFFLSYLQQPEIDLKSSRQQGALAEIEVEGENIRVAWQWAVERGTVEQLDQAANSLGIFYEWRGRYREGEAICRVAAAGPDTLATVEGYRISAKVLCWQARFNRLLGNSEDARQMAQRALGLLDDSAAGGHDVRSEKAALLLEIGEQSSNREEATSWGEQSLDLYRALEDRSGTAQALFFLGDHYIDRFETVEHGEQILRQSLAIFEDLGDRRSAGRLLRVLGFHANLLGRSEESEILLRRSLAIDRQMEDRANIVHSLNNLASLLANNYGRFATAHGLSEEAMSLAQALGNRIRVTGTAGMLAFTSLHLGRYQQALTEGQEGLRAAKGTGDLLVTSFVLWQLGDVALAEGDLERAERHLQESLTIERRARNSLRLNDVLISMGFTAYALGRSAQVRQCLAEALRGAIEVRLWFSAIRALPLAALHALEQGQSHKAVELWTMAQRYRHVANSAWFHRVAGRHVDAATGVLPPAALAAARQRGKTRELWQTVQELLKRVESMEPKVP